MKKDGYLRVSIFLFSGEREKGRRRAAKNGRAFNIIYITYFRDKHVRKQAQKKTASAVFF